MQSIDSDYGKIILPGGCGFKTIPELEELVRIGDLTTKDLDSLYELRGKWHNFKANRSMINAVSSAHNTEPNAVIFLDIRGTLFDGGTHGGSGGILGRTRLGDFKPITYEDIDALGSMISRNQSQDLKLDYELNNDYHIVPTLERCGSTLVERPLSLLERRFPNKIHRPKYMAKSGPFTVVFVSTDDVKTQKNIIALLYYMAKYIDTLPGLRGMLPDFKKTDEFIEGIISRIEYIVWEKYDNDFMKFLEAMSEPGDHKYDAGVEEHGFAGLTDFEIEDFKREIDGLFFLSTKDENGKDTGKTKEDLVQEFLESNTLRDRVGMGTYQVFAIGDDYKADGGMLRKAYMNGGFGVMRSNPEHSYSEEHIKLVRDLAKDGILLSHLPIVDSLAEFHNDIIHELTITRENELIDAMTYANANEDYARVLKGLSVPVHIEKK